MGILLMGSSKEKQFLDLWNDPELKPVIENQIGKYLLSDAGKSIISDVFYSMLGNTRLLKRVGLLEAYTGLDIDSHSVGADWEWEEMNSLEREMYPENKKIVVQPLNAQLSLLSERINDASIPILKETVFSGNETEIRARFLKDHLSEVDMRNGKRFLTSQEVQKYLLHEITEAHRTTEKAARKVANDVMRKAFEMFPESLILTKNKRRLNVIEFLGKR
ncbi:MAG: hypothetical protein PHI91_03670 [Candidatus Pacebacteria bacterium]|jgi:hypothetical protein|nr:hypothetical protein [Candidatus Paceibacterota bacterium]